MKTKNIIGLDVLKVCKQEGYMMLDTLGDKILDQNKQYPVFCYFPSHIKELKKELAINTTYSWNEAIERYRKNKNEIDSFADDMPAIMSTQEPKLSDLLAAADTINGCFGLD